MASKNPILNVMNTTKMHGPLTQMNWKSSKHCAACHYAKQFECGVMSAVR